MIKKEKVKIKSIYKNINRLRIELYELDLLYLKNTAHSQEPHMLHKFMDDHFELGSIVLRNRLEEIMEYLERNMEGIKETED